MPQRQALADGLADVFRGIQRLCAAFPHRRFTIDGRLVGDIGEVIAGLEYDLILDEVSQPDYDAVTDDGRKVQIKATFKDSLTFKSTPDYFLGFKLFNDGTFEEIYNGPGHLIYAKYKHRSGIGKNLLSFPNSALRDLAKQVPQSERIRKRLIAP